MDINQNIFERNLYELLDLDENASTKDIEEKYFKKQNQKSIDEEKLIEHAYSVLTDYHKRRDYDNRVKNINNNINKDQNLNNNSQTLENRILLLENKIKN